MVMCENKIVYPGSEYLFGAPDIPLRGSKQLFSAPVNMWNGALNSSKWGTKQLFSAPCFSQWGTKQGHLNALFGGPKISLLPEKIYFGGVRDRD